MKKYVVVIMSLLIISLLSYLAIQSKESNKTFMQDGILFAMTKDGEEVTSFPTNGKYKVKIDCKNGKGSYLYFEEENKISRLILPEKNDNNNIAISYLKSRGIDEEIIQKCIDKGFIYEQKDKHNVVFLGLDSKNNPRYAGLRGTNKTRFMQDASGSDKEFSFRLLSKNNNSSIHVFESAIDLLSYATLLKMSNKDWENENLLALAGVYQPAKDIEESKIPIALKSFLNKINIKDIYLHFDSDQAGKMATKSLKNQLEKRYNVYDFTPYIGKDYNDFLIETIKNMSKKKEINRESR